MAVWVPGLLAVYKNQVFYFVFPKFMVKNEGGEICGQVGPLTHSFPPNVENAPEEPKSSYIYM